MPCHSTRHEDPSRTEVRWPAVPQSEGSHGQAVCKLMSAFLSLHASQGLQVMCTVGCRSTQERSKGAWLTALGAKTLSIPA